MGVGWIVFKRRNDLEGWFFKFINFSDTTHGAFFEGEQGTWDSYDGLK